MSAMARKQTAWLDAGTSDKTAPRVAMEAYRVDRAGMARNSLPARNVVVVVIVAFALFVVAIITRNFWLSLILGIAGAFAFAYAAFLLREYRKRLPEDKKDTR